MNEYEQMTRELIRFIEKSPSSYHVIENFASLLKEHGFEALSENDGWELFPGHDYFVTRGQSSLIAFRVPEQAFENFQITAAHSDSPTFRIKENPEISVQSRYVQLNVEKYGGMLCAPWFDRPLSVAGRAMVRCGNVLESRLVNFDRDLCMIPSLAIHMNREANSGTDYKIQRDLLPLIGAEGSEGSFLSMIAEQLKVPENDILSYDLSLYNRVPGTIWGIRNEFFSCGKLDDLMCAWSAVTALMDGVNDRSICVAAIFDNEEVGSRTMQGADSTYLSDTLERISICLGKNHQEHLMAIASSFMISADNAHAVHPHFPEKSDPTNRPGMNHGPVIKFNAAQKYTSTAASAALFREICAAAGVPCQTFVNHSDMPGGSTLGNLANAHVSLHTVDIGMAQLAMHSPYETAGIKDTLYLVQALVTFYRTHVDCRDDAFTIG